MTPRQPVPAPRAHCEGVLCNSPHDDGECDCPCAGCVIAGLEGEARVVVGDVRSLRMMIQASTELADSFLARAEKAERAAAVKADVTKLFADERDAFQTETMRLRSGIDAAGKIARVSGAVAPALTLVRVEGFLRGLLKPVFTSAQSADAVSAMPAYDAEHERGYEAFVAEVAAPHVEANAKPFQGDSVFQIGDLVRERAGGVVMRVEQVLENGTCALRWSIVSPSGLSQTETGAVLASKLLVKVHDRLQEAADAVHGDALDREARRTGGHLCSRVGHGIDADPYGDNQTVTRKRPGT